MMGLSGSWTTLLNTTDLGIPVDQGQKGVKRQRRSGKVDIQKLPEIYHVKVPSRATATATATPEISSAPFTALSVKTCADASLIFLAAMIDGKVPSAATATPKILYTSTSVTAPSIKKECRCFPYVSCCNDGRHAKFFKMEKKSTYKW